MMLTILLSLLRKKLVLCAAKFKSLLNGSDTTFPTHYFHMRNYAPVQDEYEDFEVIACRGEIPTDLNGMYIRNGPNPQFISKYYHWFDGDGMLHAVSFENGKAKYTNKWIRTNKFEKERAAGKLIYPYMVGSMISDPLYFYKLIPAALRNFGKIDLDPSSCANTALIYHADNLLALMEPTVAYKISLPKLSTVGPFNFNGQWKFNITAHPKIDPVTEELIFFGYPPTALFNPTLRYGVASKDGKIVTQIDIPVGTTSKVMHDFAITEHYSIIMDLPYLLDVKRMIFGSNPFRFDGTMKSRFGIMPRHAKNANEIRWFETDPCYIIHTANAWEENDEVVLIVCRSDKSNIFSPNDSEQDPFFITEFRFNLKTGSTTQHQLVTYCSEFPVINEKYMGRKNKFVWTALFPGDRPIEGRSIGLAKLDLTSGESVTFRYDEHTYGGEFVFVPKSESKYEDDGYMTGFIHDELTETSYLLLLCAHSLSEIARIKMPRRVPYGFHGRWVPHPEIQNKVK